MKPENLCILRMKTTCVTSAVIDCLFKFSFLCFRTLQTALEGLFPRDNPKNTRFAINFFTSIGLGGLT